jgi:hypothetical protein
LAKRGKASDGYFEVYFPSDVCARAKRGKASDGFLEDYFYNNNTNISKTIANIDA